nr:MAG TPA: hypothetical protein [Caudoviricetes sp.]
MNKRIKQAIYIIIYTIIVILLYKYITIYTTRVDRVQATNTGELITLHTQGEYIDYYYNY